jgi:hypothetical protein
LYVLHGLDGGGASGLHHGAVHGLGKDEVFGGYEVAVGDLGRHPIPPDEAADDEVGRGALLEHGGG